MEENKLTYALAIMRNPDGSVYLAIVPHLNGVPQPNIQWRLTDTTEEVLEFYQMLGLALKGSNAPGYVA